MAWLGIMGILARAMIDVHESYHTRTGGMVFDSSPASSVTGHAVSGEMFPPHRLRVGNRLPSFWRENQRVESTK